MSESIGYAADRCKVQLDPKCKKRGGNPEAGYQRTARFARVGPWLDSCEDCAHIPYEQPEQFQERSETEDPATVGF